MKNKIVVALLSALTFMSANMLTAPASATETGAVYWLNHLDLLPGDPSVQTSFNAVNSGVGGGLSGLLITSTTTGDQAQGGGNKVVEMGVAVPPWNLVTGVRVCFEQTNPTSSYVSQIRLAQLQNPPATAMVLLDDGTDRMEGGPVCVNSTSPSSPINPANGALRLSFRVNFSNINDKILIRGVGLKLIPDPASPLQKQIDCLKATLKTHTHPLVPHTHTYLTGKGVGHNNVQATTSAPLVPTPYVTPTTPKKK